MKKTILALIIVVILLVVFLAGGFWLLFGTEAGSRFVFGKALEAFYRIPSYSIKSTEGSLLKHFVVHDLQIKGGKNRLPRGAALRISKMDIYFSVLLVKGLNVEIHNGRIILPYGGIVVLNGIYQDETFEGDIYSRNIYTGDVRRFLRDEGLFKGVDGLLNRFECGLKAGRGGATAEGKALLTVLSGKNFTLQECPFSFQLNISHKGQVTGLIDVYSGKLLLPKSRIDIKPGSFFINEPILESRLNMHGVSEVQRTNIDIVLKGYLGKPELKLTSDPPRSQERLMLMLLTGQTWESTEQAIGKGEISPDLAKDTLSFLFLDSGPGALAQKLGISDIHLEYNGQKRGVAVETNVLPKTRVTYGVEQNQQQQQQSTGEPEPLKQKVGVIYDVGEHISIEGRTDVGGYDESVTNSETQPADQALYLKYKKQF